MGSSLQTKLEKENINVKVDIIHGVGDLQRRSQVIIVKTWILLINPTLDIPDLRDGCNTQMKNVWKMEENIAIARFND